MDFITNNIHTFSAAIVAPLFLLFIIFLFNRFSSSKYPRINLPPSPPKLPIVGNLHQLGSHPHLVFHKLSVKHGPLMLIHLGRKPALVVSSADAAREIMKNHDAVFSNRPHINTADKLMYGSRDVAFAPYGDYWRQVRSICVLQLLSTKMVKSFRNVREQETSLMVEKMNEKCSTTSPVNLSEVLKDLTNDVISRVASAEAAQEIMRTQDLNFVNRPKSEVSRKLLYDYKDVSVAPYGEYWRQLKSICVMQLLSNKRVQSIQTIRNEEIDHLVRKIQEEMKSENMVNLSEIFMTLTNDVICRVAFGRKYSEGENGKQFRKLMSEFVTALGAIDFGTFLPCLGWIEYVSGLNAKLERISKEMDEFLESVLEEHLDGDHDQGRKNIIPTKFAGDRDFVDVLLGIYNDGVSSDDAGDSSITRESIKALLLDIFAGGTDTTYTVLEWAMTLLIKHPKIMEDLQNEVRTIAKESRAIIIDQDLEKMKCLKAVIKETLRLHPPIPLLVPRTAIKDTKVLGFDVEAETMVITNSFAIGRDPRSWDVPDEFRQERFSVDDSTASIDFRGRDFQLIPFGSGRRGCPGISFAIAVNEAVLANLMLRFDWQLLKGNLCLDMAEGLTMHRKNLLRVVVIPVS